MRGKTQPVVAGERNERTAVVHDIGAAQGGEGIEVVKSVFSIVY